MELLHRKNVRVLLATILYFLFFVLLQILDSVLEGYAYHNGVEIWWEAYGIGKIIVLVPFLILLYKHGIYPLKKELSEMKKRYIFAYAAYLLMLYLTSKMFLVGIYYLEIPLIEQPIWLNQTFLSEVVMGVVGRMTSSMISGIFFIILPFYTYLYRQYMQRYTKT